MGCELGKLASSGDNKKDVESNEPPAPSATDPRLPLTARQKYSMVASWKGISRAMEPTGINMFIKWVSEWEKNERIAEEKILCNKKGAKQWIPFPHLFDPLRNTLLLRQIILTESQ